MKLASLPSILIPYTSTEVNLNYREVVDTFKCTDIPFHFKGMAQE